MVRGSARWRFRHWAVSVSALRVVVLAGAIVWSGSSALADDCSGLEGDDQTLCTLMARCNAIEEVSKRWSCLRAAAQLRSSLESAATTSAEVADETPRQDPDVETAVVPPSSPQVLSAPQTVSAPTDPAAGRQVTPEAARDEKRPGVTQKSVTFNVFEIPDSFEGRVTAVRRLVRDRQLIAVDDQMVFQGDVAVSSMVEKGDLVEVERLSTMFKSERYRIIPPSKRTIMARRIPCESLDLTRDSRKKCALIEDKVAER